MPNHLDCCPTCKRPYPTAPTRVCRKCKNVIHNHHKWTLIPLDGDLGTYAIEHKNCKDPTSYQKAKKERTK